MFIKYSTSLISPKKSRDIGQGSKRVIKKEVTISTDDNIIPEPDVALDLRKSMSITEAAEDEATRQVHATHERIMTESDLEPARRRPSEKLVADTIKALKASRKSIRSQPHAGGPSEGTGTKSGVPDESTVTPTTSKEDSEYTEEDDDDENIEWVDTDEEEDKNDDDDDKSIDLEKIDDEETDDEFVQLEEYVQDDDEETHDETVHGDEKVNDDENEEMTNAKDVYMGNGDEVITYMAKADAKKHKKQRMI
ncbi:hypothetical protein Tco_0063959 [Tanacetum coccineum]